MSDSDSDTDCKASRPRRIMKHDTVVTFRPSDEIFAKWTNIPDETKRDAAQRMKICAFWLPTLLQREESNIACWAVEIGLVSSKDSEDLSLTHLRKIESVEAILRAMERGTIIKNQARHVLIISNMFNLRSPEVMENALQWLDGTGEPDIRQRLLEFGHRRTCSTALHLIFTEFAKFVQEMGGSYDKTMKSLFFEPADYQVEKSDEMKLKGNENFQKQQYEEAVKFYSKAIKFYPDNHLLYGNRALCYIRCKNYLKAVGDGKRAILIKPLWAKGHYRFCEALFSLGEIKMALDANCLAQRLCEADGDGVKDLEQQHEKFIDELSGGWASKTSIKSPGQHFKVGLVTQRPQSAKAVSKNNPATSRASKVSEGKTEKHSAKNDKHSQSERKEDKETKPSKSDFSSKNGKGESHAAAKKKPRNRNSPTDEENQTEADGKPHMCGKLRSLVQDAHTALTDLRSRNAEQAFSQALASLKDRTAKEFGLTTLDVLLLLFGRASALTEIGQPEELVEAQKLLEKMKSYEERTFQCLVYYAIGRVYLRENRFAVALEQFSDAQQMVKNQITPGKLTWPLTKEIVKETQADYFKEILESAIEQCRFPPLPDAICRLEKCHSALKAEIFFTDPDFKGFIQFCCCQSCKVEYHIACWKTLKSTSFFDKNEKDFLQEACLTPDCVGQICSIKIYGPTGLVKCKFEAAVAKPQSPRKPKVNQKCTSQKKLKSKEERRLKRKQHKQSFQDKQTINEEILQQKEDTATQSQQKAWLLYRDRVLLQINQHMELLREEKGLQVSALTSSLKPWLELDLSRGNQLAGRMLNWQQEQLETLGQAVELLLERRNRVWARVFIQQLSICEDINPKLNSWACQLNDAGLNAARTFIERYAGHLEQLDLAVLLSFGPLQEIIIEKLGARPEIFSSIGLTMTDYLKQAPPHDMRLFIWTLEEHRDVYDSCHTILDEYFDMMDGHCSVLKKSDENQNNSPMKTKSRGRKKKQKEPKGVIVLSGMRGVTPREEWDQDLFEDEALSFLDPVDPFSVPSHLREQVADFEDQYNGTRRRGLYKSILDNNPDSTRESLYDYFAQILDEHGPLVAEDPLLVGELENFPSVAQQKIQDAGGFESFLLESLRFIKMGRCIGLAHHAVSLQQAGHGASLDDLDDIADSVDSSPPPDWQADVDYVNGFSSPQQDFYPILPNPYVFGFQPTDVDPFTHWSNGDSEQAAYFLPENYGDIYTSEAHGVFETDPAEVTLMAADENFLKRDAEVQTCPEAMRSVAVNTELHERFESYQGDINKLEKNNRKLEQQIEKMSNGCDKVSLSNREDVCLLEEDIRKITVNIQVTNKELVLFQQKLEEEVKKDQNEKKANQEILKALKVEIEGLVENHGSLARSIQEKKASYEAKLTDFLELGNQSEAKKLSLEDAINRSKASFASAKRRSHTAQLLAMKSSHDQALYGLEREQADAKAFLTKLDDAKHRHQNQELDLTINSCRANIEEIGKKISAAERLYKQQMDQVNNGRRAAELLPANNQPEPAAAQQLSAAAKEFTPQSSAQTSHSAPSPIHKPAPPAAQAPTAPAQMQRKPPTRATEPPHTTVFEKAMERLVSMFPNSTRQELMKFVQELRSTSGGTFSNMTLQDVVGGATQLILDHQERLNSARSSIVGRGSPAQCATPPLVNPATVWQAVGSQRAANPNALNMEDPCIICHEDMIPEETSVLECRHSFHKECIKSWLKEQSTCPTCRNHALLPEDFPVLPGRRRQGP